MKYENDEQINKLLEEIYIKYNKNIYKTAYLFLKDSSLAEDIVQDTMLKIREKIVKKEIITCHKIGSLIGYIVKGLCVDFCRKRKRITYREIYDYEIPYEENIFVSIAFKESLNELPEKYRKVLIMKELKGMSYLEISEHIGLQEATIRKQIERGKKLLKEIMCGDDYE